jgi:uncharacterized membrane protein YdjX (TVP38/TMEM64 family)
MRRYARISVKIVLLVAVVLITRYAFTQGYTSEWQIRRLADRAGILAAPAFILMFALSLVTFVASPGLFVAVGAITFGRTMGAAYSLLGIMTGACAAFLLGRYVVTDLARRQRVGRLKRIDEYLRLNGSAFMISLRLSLFANPVLNYAASQTPVTLRDYLIGSFVGCIPGVLVIPYVADVVIHVDSLVDMAMHPVLYSMGLLRMIGLALFIILIRRYRRKTPGRHGHTEEGGIAR